jgi:endoglucanase
VHDQFTKAKNFAEKHHVPVWLGEFGSFHKADMKSRVMWAEFVARTAESYGFSWAYWDFCSPWFGLYDRRTRAWNAELLDVLMGTR